MVEAVRHGMSNRQIARRRGVSLDAVKYHLGNAVEKEGRTLAIMAQVAPAQAG